MMTGSLSDISHKKRLMVALFALTAIVGVIFIYAKMRVHALSSLTFDQVDDTNLQCIEELLSGQEIDENLDKFYSVEIRTILFDHIKTEYSAVTVALKSLGIILVFINMCEKLIKTMEKGEMTEEQWLSIILTLAVPVVFISEYDKIVTGLQQAGDTIYGMITASRQSLTGSTKDFINALIPEGFKPEFPEWSLTNWPIKEFTEMLIKTIKAYVMGFTIQVILEIATFFINLSVMNKVLINYASLALRFIFMPLAIANINKEGTRSSGMRYILKFIAIYIELAAISLVVHIVFYCYIALMSGTIALTFGQCILFYILLAPAMKGAMNASTKIIEQALGASMH